MPVSHVAEPRHHNAARKQPMMTNGSSGFSGSHKLTDPYHDHRETAKLCARFLMHVFECPDIPPPSPATRPPVPSPPLAQFVASVLFRTKLHSSVTFGALYLLHRLKARYPAAKGSSGHRLFLSAFMIASKVISDNSYSNKTGWAIVGQGMFALREINQMERDMCSYLEWQLNFEPRALEQFEAKVRRDFQGAGPYPPYKSKMPEPDPMPSTTPYVEQAGGIVTAPAASFTAPSQKPPSMSPSQPMSSPVPVQAGAPPHPAQSAPSTRRTLGSAYSMSTSNLQASKAVRHGGGKLATAVDPFRQSSTTVGHLPTRVQPAPGQPPKFRTAPKKPQHGDIFTRLKPSVW